MLATARTWVCRSAFGLLCALLLTACGLWVSFDGYDTSSSPAGPPALTPFHAVSGAVEGLADGARVRLTLNAPQNALELSNEPFTFSEKLALGQHYEVKADPPDGHACAVNEGTGTITGDVNNVAVHCTSNVATLSNLSVSAGELDRAFEPATDNYEVRFTQLFPRPQSVRITPTAHSPNAIIRINGTEVKSGSESFPIDVPALHATTPIDVEVTASNQPLTGPPVTKRYALVLGDQPIDYLKASNTRSGASFGVAIALSGDTLAVGASNESSAATGVDGNQADTSLFDAGAVYVFVRIGNAWSQQAYIKASRTRSRARFGSSVALSGDTLIVGAPQEPSDTGVADAGAAYVFTRTAGVWSQQARLTASNSDSPNSFGAAVTMSGETIAIGAYGDSSAAVGIDGDPLNVGAFYSGAVHVFTRSAGAWSRQAYVKASNARANARFGTSVSLSGDTLAVGAPEDASAAIGINGPQDDGGAPYSGAAYVFTRTAGTWSQQAYVKASNTREYASFGCAVAVSADTLAVGSRFEWSAASGIDGDQTAGLSQFGAAYVFVRTGEAWSQQAYVKASNTPATGLFGWSVALAGDTLAVGAPQEQTGARGVNGSQSVPPSVARAGAVYLFTRAGVAWSQASFVKATNTQQEGFFGSSVALSAQVLAVGSSGERSSATGVNGNQADMTLGTAGAAYVYR